MRGSGKEVVQLVGESAPMAGVLPLYLARDAARRLSAAGVRVRAGAELEACAAHGPRLSLRLADGEALDADLVVECAGAEPDAALADASGLETHPQLGGLLVNAELQARSDVYAAGDTACFYDVVLGRRRVEHHDHAVVSGRLAGENMAAVAPPKHYTHQSMFWSDLGPQLGYEVGRPRGPGRRPAGAPDRARVRRPSASSTRVCPRWVCSRPTPWRRRWRRPRRRAGWRHRRCPRRRRRPTRPRRRRAATSAAWCSTCASVASWACCSGTSSTACTSRAR